MIIKAKVRAGPAQLADYLLRNDNVIPSTKKFLAHLNERAELLETRGWGADHLKDSLKLEADLARYATRCEKPFYHVAFRAAPGEELTPEQWRYCADKLEQAVGLEGHSRALVTHEKDGETHLHVVWSRCDPETWKATNMFRDHYHCKEVAREIEKELGLTQVRDKAPERELAAPTFNEDQQARRKGQDLDKARATIREAWERSDDGKSFADELKERGFTLAKGDRRDFVALDQEGSVYSIGKRTTGARAADVREKLADLDRDNVPTIDKVRGQKREERILKRQDEIKAELVERQEAKKEELERRTGERAEKLEDWFVGRMNSLALDRDNAATARCLTSLAEAEKRIQNRFKADAARRERDQQERHAEQRAKLEIKQAETREKHGIHAPDRDEAASAAKRTLTKIDFARAARETGGDALKAAAEPRKADKEQKERPAIKHLERSAAAPTQDLVPDKGADRAVGAVVDVVTKPLDGLLDFFLGSTKPKEPERPRYKSNAELDAENKAAARAESDRLRSMTDEERQQEREKRERERERRRELYRDR